MSTTTPTALVDPTVQVRHRVGCPATRYDVDLPPTSFAPTEPHVRCCDCSATHPPQPDGFTPGPLTGITDADGGVTMVRA